MAHYSVEVLDGSGRWAVLGATLTYDRAERWVATLLRQMPETPVRVMDRPAGIMVALHDDCRLKVAE